MKRRHPDSDKIKNLYTSIDTMSISDEEKYRFLTQNDPDIAEYKQRISNIVQQKGLGSYMNDSKWLTLQSEMLKLKLSPAYNEKLVTDSDFNFERLKTESCSYLGDWSPFYMEGMPLFFSIEFLVIIPKYSHYVGKLVENRITDFSKDIEDILISNGIPYEMVNSNFVVYGYK